MSDFHHEGEIHWKTDWKIFTLWQFTFHCNFCIIDFEGGNDEIVLEMQKKKVFNQM